MRFATLCVADINQKVWWGLPRKHYIFGICFAYKLDGQIKSRVFVIIVSGHFLVMSPLLRLIRVNWSPKPIPSTNATGRSGSTLGRREGDGACRLGHKEGVGVFASGARISDRGGGPYSVDKKMLFITLILFCIAPRKRSTTSIPSRLRISQDVRSISQTIQNKLGVE